MTGEHARVRYTFIDVIRGLAACSVLLQHSLEASGIETVEKGGFALSWLNLGETGVLAFFFVSGFVIPLSLEKWSDVRHFWINRALRIYPLYITIFFITYITRAILAGDESRIVPNFLLNLTFLQEYAGTPNYVGGSWTLFLELVWYIGFTILYVTTWNARPKLVVLLTSVIALTAAAVCAAHIVRLPMGRVGLLAACVLGLFFYRLEQERIQPTEFRRLAGVLVAVIAIGLLAGFHINPSSMWNAASLRCVLLSWTLGLALFAGVYLLRRRAVSRMPFLLLLGKISYSIYLVHPVVLELLARTPLHGGAFVMATFALTIPLSLLTYTVVEQPAIRFSHGLRQRLGVN